MVYRTLKTLFSFYKEVQFQKKYQAENLIPKLNRLEKQYFGSFSKEQKKKIINYYGLFISSILCSNIKKLYSAPYSIEEREKATYFGILTPVGDDLFDIEQLPLEALKKLSLTPNEYQPTTFSAFVAKDIQLLLASNVKNPAKYLEDSFYVFSSQVDTLKQTDSSISKSELERITFEKGGYSVLLFHHALNEELTDEMHDMLFLLGSILQLGNDIFDIYKDVHEGIYTLITQSTDLTIERKLLLKLLGEFKQTTNNLPLKTANIANFQSIMIAINARSLTALDKLIEFQKRSQIPLNWNICNRKDLICDLENPVYFTKWLKNISLIHKL